MAGANLLTSGETKRLSQGTGPYVLSSLLDEVSLSAEGDRDDIEITCVEFFGRAPGAGYGSKSQTSFEQPLTMP